MSASTEPEFIMTSTDTRDGFDAVVLGAGEAGTIVASLAVESGLSVALVYREPWGSTCLNVGCVPSKFLIHRARVAHLTRTAGRFGVQAGDPTVDLHTIVDEKRATVDGHRPSRGRGRCLRLDWSCWRERRGSCRAGRSGSGNGSWRRTGYSSRQGCAR
jgi:hypothetical protein